MKTKRKIEPATPPAPILALPLNTEPATVTQAREAGYVVILTDDADKVKLIMPATDAVGGDMLMSALWALCQLSDQSGRAYFTMALQRRLQAREDAAKPAQPPPTPADPAPAPS